MTAKEQSFSLVKSSTDKRFHVMKMQSLQPVNLASFSQPLHLQRKKTAGSYRSAGGNDAMDDDIDQNYDQSTMRNSDRPSLDRSLVAPYGGAAALHRQMGGNNFKAKTRQLTIIDDHERKLKSEESQPWVLEDDQGENTWLASLERQPSEYMLFVLTDVGFEVVPVERWYKFKEKQKYKTLTYEQAEEISKSKKRNQSQDRWLMDKFKISQTDTMFGPNLDTNASAESAQGINPTSRPSAAGDDERRTIKGDAEFEELDFDLAEEFQDDEEDNIFENFEDERETAKRDMKQKTRVGLQYQAEEEDNIELSKDGKKMRRKLAEVDETAYDTDNDNPYEDDEEALEDPKPQDMSKFPVPGGFIRPRIDGPPSNNNQPAVIAKKSMIVGGSSSPQTLPGNSSMVSSFLKKRTADAPETLGGNMKRPKLKATDSIATTMPTTATQIPGNRSPPNSSKKSTLLTKTSKPQSTQPVVTGKQLSSASPVLTAPARSGNASPNDSLIFTREEIIRIIRNHSAMTSKDLVNLIKPRIKQHPQNNKEMLVALVREVAVKRPDGTFDLKDEFKNA